MIKLIIFDLDGTLVNAYAAIAESFNFTMEKMGLPQQRLSKIKRAVGWGDQALLKPFVKAGNLKKALLIYREHHRRSLKVNSCLLPGAQRVLSYFKSKNYLLAVASNRPREFSDIVLRHLKIYKYFDYILCADQIKRPKPYPDIIKRIVKSLFVTNMETIYVGDMVVDVEAGKNAGVITAAVLTGSSERKELVKAGPDFIFQDVSGLLRIL